MKLILYMTRWYQIGLCRWQGINVAYVGYRMIWMWIT